MKKLKSLFKTYGARIGALVMCFVLLIPMLCSATALSYSIPYTLSNPDNIPQDLTVSSTDLSSPQILDFGSGTIYTSSVLTVVDGQSYFEGIDVSTTVPDGKYMVFGILIEQPSGYSSTVGVRNGVPATISEEGYDMPVYYADSLDLVVVERDDSLQLIDFLIVLVRIPPMPTDSITSVWSGILNWGISSLGAVQGIFYGSSETHYIPDYSEPVIVNGTPYYPMGLFDLSLIESDGAFYYNGTPIDFDVISTTTITSDGITYTGLVLDDSIPFLALGSLSGTFALLALDGYSFVAYGDSGLTLLGTLAVIGLAIAVAFLLIGIIQRFLKLRG